MENKSKHLKWLVLIVFLIIIAIISIYKVTKNREEKLYNVLYSKIEYAANSCFLKQECVDSITLKELYEKNYLEEQYDPITKELLDSNLKIEYKDNKVIIYK